MNQLLVIAIIALFFYFVFYKKESFDNLSNDQFIDILLKYLNSDNPNFIEYSRLLNNLKNTSDSLGKIETFKRLLNIKSINYVLKPDNIKVFL